MKFEFGGIAEKSVLAVSQKTTLLSSVGNLRQILTCPLKPAAPLDNKTSLTPHKSPMPVQG
jgi:hypothetical protein